MLNLTLLNILKTITAVDNTLYTGSDHYIIVAEIPAGLFEKILYARLSFFIKARLRFL